MFKGKIAQNILHGCCWTVSGMYSWIPSKQTLALICVYVVTLPFLRTLDKRYASYFYAPDVLVCVCVS